MLTNEKIAAIHANAVAHGFWEPGSEPTFGEYCALIHEEISEAFSAWRNGEPDEYVKDGKPEGVWVELADVVIRCADAMAAYGIMLDDDTEVMILNSECTFADFISAIHYEVARIWNATGNEFLSGNVRYGIYGEVMTIVVNGIYGLAKHCNIDLDAVIERKCAYNATRPYKHGKRM
jgi:NTP pyrophosphatase (non-canonical NTP hydrolase)